MTMTPAILNLVLTPLAALSGMERWQGRNMPTDTNVGLGGYGQMIFAGVLLLLLLGVLVLLIGRRRGDQNRAGREFGDMCSQRGLSAEEIEFLRLLAKLGGVGTVSMIFTLKPEFERGVSTLLASERITGMSDNGRDCMVHLLNSLRQKLAFSHQMGAEGDMISHTRQIPARSLLSLTPPGVQEALDAHLLQCDPFELIVEVQHPVDAHPGETWLARYCDGGSVWEFGAAVIRQVDNRIYLKHADNIRFINRRSFPRIQVRRPALIATFPFDVTRRQEGPPKFENAQLVELAGVGLKFECAVEIPQGQRALVILKLDSDKTVQSLVKIHRCSETAEKQYAVVAEMIGLSSGSITELTRLTNQAAIDHKKIVTAAAAPMRPARASQEASNV